MTVNILYLTMIVCGALTILCALGVILAKKPLHSALWLIVTFFMLAVNYGLLRADFIAVLQILIYAGAIMVLIVFTLMLLGSAANAERPHSLQFKIMIALLGLWFIAIIIGILFSAPAIYSGLHYNQQFIGDIKSFGNLLFTRYLWAFEVVGVLLLATTVGVTFLVYEPKRELPPGRGLKAKRRTEDQNE